MLREIQGVRQDKSGLTRRWYQDEFFDLYTWQAANGELVGFQLCYDVNGRERALSWQRQRGFSHNGIDSSIGSSMHPATPILAAGGRFPHRWVRTHFNQHAVTLDARTRRFIQDKMREYGRFVARGVVTLPPLRVRRASVSPPD